MAIKRSNGLIESLFESIKKFFDMIFAPFSDHHPRLSIVRISLNRELFRQFKRLKPGIVLDVGSKDAPYKDNIPHTEYMRLDMDPGADPHICCDIHDIRWQSDYFDTIIATELIEHLHDPQKAIQEIFRVLKPGGVCILSTRFMHAYHPDPIDYYRFSAESLNHLLKDFSKVEIFPHGNRLQIFWMILTQGRFGSLFNILNPLIAGIQTPNPRIPLGYVVYAEK